jgi:hypothetical protein
MTKSVDDLKATDEDLTESVNTLKAKDENFRVR